MIEPTDKAYTNRKKGLVAGGTKRVGCGKKVGRDWLNSGSTRGWPTREVRLSPGLSCLSSFPPPPLFFFPMCDSHIFLFFFYYSPGQQSTWTNQEVPDSRDLRWISRTSWLLGTSSFKPTAGDCHPVPTTSSFDASQSVLTSPNANCIYGAPAKVGIHEYWGQSMASKESLLGQWRPLFPLATVRSASGQALSGTWTRVMVPVFGQVPLFAGGYVFINKSRT